MGEKYVKVLISRGKLWREKISSSRDTFSRPKFQILYFSPTKFFQLFPTKLFLLLRTRLKRKYFICSIEKHPWKCLQWKITTGILLSVDIKKNWGKRSGLKNRVKALSSNEISGNFFGGEKIRHFPPIFFSPIEIT